MIDNIFKFFFGSRNDRLVKSLRSRVAHITDLEPEISKLSDDQLKAKTNEFRERIAQGEDLDFITNEAFAVVREASKRVTGMRQYDVQLIGGLVLTGGNIAEMRTGEGKTLVAVAPVYLNALSGHGAHVVTVNDYLASRDAEIMKPIYNFLGLSVDTIVGGKDDRQRREAYGCDITYGTNNEFGFDYLRDNMRFQVGEQVQRGFNFAIVDEVDSILIDEARTPLIISGPGDGSSELYVKVDAVIKRLTADDYEKDEKQKNIIFTEAGTERIEQLLKQDALIQDGGLYDVQNMHLVHYANQSLKANFMFKKEVDYIVKNNKVLIVDEFTGRIMDGRRYSDGLHQALEAKENVTVQMENQTLASITFQNFFKLYKKLSGMTGTALTEAAEFSEIYNLDTIVIPTNLPICRIDDDDEVYRTIKEKYDAILATVKECHNRKQPVLIGTSSIEKSEELDDLLTKAKIPHSVLNAKYHKLEAQIIAEAGAPGAITIATNMAGRGTDIKLGGNLEQRLIKALAEVEDINEHKKIKKQVEEQYKKDKAEVEQAGGLYIIGTERHESRRIDNQLRGRAGRQGDPGHSKFYLSLQDDLMRIFGGERLDNMLQKVGLQPGEAITHPWVNKAIEKAQRRVEAHNFDIRKHLLKFDNVMNEQRKIIYQERDDLMSEEHDTRMALDDSFHTSLEEVFNKYFVDIEPGTEPDLKNLKVEILSRFNINLDAYGTVISNMSSTELRKVVEDRFTINVESKYQKYGEEAFEEAQKIAILQILDQKWKEHLLNLDKLRQGVNLRAYAQKDPLNEYKVEAFSLFDSMVTAVKAESLSVISRLEIQPKEDDLTALLRTLTETAAKDEKMSDLHYSAPDEQTGNDFEKDEKDLLTKKKTRTRNPKNTPKETKE